MFNQEAVYNKFDDNRRLNKKPELVYTCRHKNKLLLRNLKRNCSRNDAVDWVFW